MYDDLSVPIDESLPERIKEEIRDLEAAYLAGDELAYSLGEDAVEVDLRAALAAKCISPEVFHKMHRKFGWG